MTGYQAFRVIKAIFALIALIFIGVMIFIACIWRELSTETGYRGRYGEDWQIQFEKDHGSLATAHQKIAISVIGIVAVGIALVWIYRLLTPGQRGQPNILRHRFNSNIEGIVHYRRNAVMGVYFGLAGSACGVLLVVFRIGLFTEHANEVVLGIFVFLGGYAGVISGCWYWAKAKAWNDAVVLIGLLPLVVLLIPFCKADLCGSSCDPAA